MEKKTARLRRAKSTRMHIRKLAVPRLTVHRSGQHIYAQVIAPEGDKVLAAASTVQKTLREGLKRRIRRVRPFRIPLPRPHQGTGGCRPRSGPEILSPRFNDPTTTPSGLMP